MSRRFILHRSQTRGAMAAASFAVLAAFQHPSPAGAEEITGLAKRLADLRGEVESQSDELSTRKSELHEELRSFARQKSELELEIQREETRVQKLRQAVAQKRAETAAQKSGNQSLAPIFDKHIAETRGYVQNSLPFRRKERLAELAKLDEQFKSGLLAPQRALNRLWSFVEDELRMTRESGLFAQPVVVDGKEQLADVVRVGMVMMYFRTPQEEYGATQHVDGQWSFRSIDDRDEQKRVRTLFDTFKKQIRVGYFELPNALPQSR